MEEASKLFILQSYLNLFSKSLTCDLFEKSEIDKLFYHLSHQEEKEILHRDKWGNWDYPFTMDDYTRPHLDYFVQDKMKLFGVKQTGLWPEGKKFAFCITHDVDHIGLNRLQESQRFRTKKLPATAHLLFSKLANITTRFTGHNKLWCYEKWTEFINKAGYKSTFFIYINPACTSKQHLYDNLYEADDMLKYGGKKMTVSAFVRTLSDNGFEIGLHGSYFSATDSAIFREQKEKLEQIIGKEIRVARQHFLRYDINKTPSVHAANEILVDSTLGYNRAIGFRAGTCMPYIIQSSEGSRILEIPMHIMDGALFTSNALELNEDLAIKKSIQLMEHCEKAGGVLTINFHPNYIICNKWWNVFKAIVSEAKRRNAYNASLSQIYDCVCTFRSANQQ